LNTDPQTDPRVKHLRDAQRRLRSALIANADRLDKPFTDDPDKNPWDTFVRPAMRELKAAVDAIAAMPAAPVAVPPTGQGECAQCGDTGACNGGPCPLADPSDAHRLALSSALGLGTSAPWDAIRERAAELAGQGVAVDRVAELERLRTENARMRHELEVMYGGAFDSQKPEPATRAAALLEEAARIRAHCPDHLDSDSAEGTWLACHCAVADDMERRLAAETPGPETQGEAPPVCEGFVWIGQSFATCDRCGQPAWDHEGEEVAVEGAGPFGTGRVVRPWKPGVAEAIRAKWALPGATAPAVVAEPGKEG
jgi:hypothetical protein